MDQHVISGIGNIYSDEILFQAMIHPERRIPDFGQDDLKKVFTRMKKVLRESAEEYAGSGNFPSAYLIPNRKKGGQCPRCGTPLEHRPFGGRTFWFCPECQKK
jgi:formamidopyrimidine-DNA glycosylase